VCTCCCCRQGNNKEDGKTEKKSGNKIAMCDRMKMYNIKPVMGIDRFVVRELSGTENTSK
jgi:hypothetical protein